MSNHESPTTNHGFFVTGTDTGVGKTLAACALLHGLSPRGLCAIGMKPVAADALLLGDIEFTAAPDPRRIAAQPVMSSLAAS